jgi:hypothetical protein
MKTKRFFLFGLPVVLLALGLVVSASLTLAGCSTDSDDGNGGTNGNGGGDNPFVGVWNGTATLGENSANATVTVTAAGWNIICTVANMNESGTYTRSGNTASLIQSGVVFGTAVISGSTLTVTITTGDYQGGSGTFQK